MSFKNDVKKTVADVGDAIKHSAKDVRDAAAEHSHHDAAEAERMRRELHGDDMTSDEKLESLAEEGKHRIKAGAEHAKRTIRDNT